MTFRPGDRVLNTRDEIGTVVARKRNTPPGGTRVVYDGDDTDTIWITPTLKLRLAPYEGSLSDLDAKRDEFP